MVEVELNLVTGIGFDVVGIVGETMLPYVDLNCLG